MRGGEGGGGKGRREILRTRLTMSRPRELANVATIVPGDAICPEGPRATASLGRAGGLEAAPLNINFYQLPPL